ncbi:dihydrodipicolinate synthase family protein [Rubinisphaera margarita]|uniref:dihydrodipicolinate synthase family protein n=1 Tax=Rubinisphaera margarita TaxID=2909586 RepID=UPI001EE86DDC|nr:dihydrodipicolinate synthase family protein [Rubinisphaera margarita]MCG6154383.1 dihydrodipicolinate synthase family protein [Rubinisphaera margarita]
MSLPRPHLQGLIAATFTPFQADGSLDLDKVPAMVDHLVEQKIAGLYVLGSTGEGISATFQERCDAAEAFISAAAGRLPVIIQVGCESLAQAAELAAHAQAAGADAISAVSPVYFKPDSVETLIASMAQITAGAPELPFYYYHIPAITGVNLNMVEFLSKAGDRIPTLAGIKFTSPAVHEFQACVEAGGDRYQIFWGLDEMLLAGLTAGAVAAVGSTYNFAAPVYQQLLNAYAAGDLTAAQQMQSRSQEIVRTFVPYGPRAAQKTIMSLIGVDCGPPRLPNVPLTPERTEALRSDLEQIGFFDWIRQPAGSTSA